MTHTEASIQALSSIVRNFVFASLMITEYNERKIAKERIMKTNRSGHPTQRTISLVDTSLPPKGTKRAGIGALQGAPRTFGMFKGGSEYVYSPYSALMRSRILMRPCQARNH